MTVPRPGGLPTGPIARTLACVAAAAAVHAHAPPPDALRAGLAIFVLIGGLWITQAVHLTVTALLVPLLAVSSGLVDVRGALAPFANPTIFLFLGGFALAAAFQQQGLDRALALAMIRLAGGRRLAAVLMLFAMTAVLSMWMSNSATAAMMLPLALGLLREDGDDGGGGRGDEAASGPAERAFVLLGMAYSANIGGIGTLVGSPPNAIAAAHVGMGFGEWLRIGIPMVLVLMPVMVATLALVLRPRLGGRMSVRAAARSVPTSARARRVTVIVFALTVAGWIGSASIGRALGLKGDVDAIVALAAIVALVAGGAIGWAELERRTQWGVLLLFGGGLALSELMGTSGASRYLADGLLAGVAGMPPLVMLVASVAFVVFLTELISNTAAAALLVPIFVGLSGALGLPPAMVAACIAVSASCGFMLPMGTPPNAIVYGTEQVPMATMMRCGLVLDLACVGVIVGVVLAIA